ncbi:MAG: PfkB family carbohydrate kinase [Verrucomicrobiota bacterium]
MRNGILAGGNWIIDHVKRLDAWPAQDTLVSILDQMSSNGGSPYNILKDLARLGATFPLEGVGLVGDDANGRAILDDCRAHGIATGQMAVTSAAATSYTDVMTVQATGRRTFFHQRGANAHLDVEHFDFTRTQAKHFHLGYLLLLDRLDTIVDGQPRAVEVLKRAHAAGLTTSVDCVSETSERFKSVILPTLPHVDVLFANDFEAEKISGVALRRDDVVDAVSVGRVARQLLSHGVRGWVVIHFPEAVYACSAKGEGIWQPSVKVPREEIAGSAGAGDALAAGMLFGLLEGWPIKESLQLGVCAAALSLSHPTCSEGIRSAPECLLAGALRGYHSLPR